MSYDHQDWTPVVFHKKPEKELKGEAAVKAAVRNGFALDTQKKFNGGKNVQHGGPDNAAKLDRETEELKHTKIRKETSQAIVKARLAKGMTQAQLAAAIFESVQIVQSYENGSAIPNGNVLSKMSRALGVTLKK